MTGSVFASSPESGGNLTRKAESEKDDAIQTCASEPFFNVPVPVASFVMSMTMMMMTMMTTTVRMILDSIMNKP